MKTMLKAMKKKNSGIPTDALPVFEEIIQKHLVLGGGGLTGTGNVCEAEFFQAMEEHLTQEERFRFFAQCGGCKGTGDDKRRKAFAAQYAETPLAERLELFVKAFDRDGRVLNTDGTITVTFKCTHGYYKRIREGKPFNPPASLQTYFDCCAGGRLYELEKALGIKLKIKSVDISPLTKNPENPVVFTFEVVD
jgi:predicted metal-binding protein